MRFAMIGGMKDGVVPLKHVLVVDDDPMILDIISRALDSPELRVSTARRVSIARDVLARQTVDLVVSDARIPGETGLDLAERAKELGIAFILMSGDPEWAADHGLAPEQYVAKPFELRALVALIQDTLARSGQPVPPRGSCSPKRQI